MNTPTAPTDAALLRANILGFATMHKFANVDEKLIPVLYKRAEQKQASQMQKLAKVREIVMNVLHPKTA